MLIIETILMMVLLIQVRILIMLLIIQEMILMMLLLIKMMLIMLLLIQKMLIMLLIQERIVCSWQLDRTVPPLCSQSSLLIDPCLTVNYHHHRHHC